MSKRTKSDPVTKDIAIVGIACRFPGAENYNDFWQNLSNQVSSIVEIPAERWDHKEYYSPNLEDSNKTISKWGGFISDHDKFDAPMFKVSPREAEFMDPQQRIMLELTRSCMEDAGYQPAHFSGTATAVYVGACNNDYKEVVERSLPAVEAHISTGVHPCLIPNRVSYVYDLKGPCMMIDTACSSSLVAFNEAVNAIERGDCSAAFVGGVSVLTSPTHFISFSKTGMLSKSGLCKTFDDSADGYVRGEGAAMMLIKPLAQAKKDNDNIHAVIKGVAVNHGGKVATVTSPNPYAQSQVIVKAMENANLDITNINYMEAHGTGTPKGDPIEITGLKRAFSLMAKNQGKKLEKEFCGIGSVKTNIGHLESVSGIAGMTKVIMAMKHKTLPGLMHFKKLNSRIKLDSSPFYIVEENQPWKASKDGLRRAGISSFGFGGVNGHIILEEYPDNIKQKPVALDVSLPKPIPFVLSGKNKDAIKRYAKVLSDYLTDSTHENNVNFNLASFVYTLQNREPLEQRVAFEVQSLSQLQKNLLALANDEPIAECFEANIKQSDKPNRETQSLAEFWVCGGEVKSWDECYKKLAKKHMPHKLHLPTYPFAKKRYWIEQMLHTGQMLPKAQKQISSTNAITEYLHPLVHRNSSTLSGLRFTSEFSGEEHFLNDHQVNGSKILPGMAYLEMARAACQLASDNNVNEVAEDQSHKAIELKNIELKNIELKNIVWMRPLIISDKVLPIHIRFEQKNDGYSSYQVYTGSDNEKLVHAQGQIREVENKNLSSLPLEQLKQQMVLSETPVVKYYQKFADMGFNYGPAHQGIQEVYRSTQGVLAKLSIPADIAFTQQQFLLHPSILDSALQASIILSWDDNNLDSVENKTLLPFALSHVEISSTLTANQLPETFWAWIRYADDQKSLDIDLSNEQGQVCISLKGFTSRNIENRLDTPQNLLLTKPCWSSLPTELLNVNLNSIDYAQHHLVFIGFNKNKGLISKPNLALVESQFNQDKKSKLICHLPSQSNDVSYLPLDKQFEINALALFDIVKNNLLEQTKSISSKEKLLLQVVVPNSGEAKLLIALSGLLRTAQLESPKLVAQIIAVSNELLVDELAQHMKVCAQYPQQQVFRVNQKKLEVCTYQVIDNIKEKAEEIPFKEGGTYLITGGLGGLGKILTSQVAQSLQSANIILTGRSVISPKKIKEQVGVERDNINIEYHCIDVCNKAAIDSLIKSIVEDYGTINGVIHCAGCIKDNFIIKKTHEELVEVLAPKTSGLINLDLATQALPLEFFVLFSSTSGALGNLGQADYATANAFMDVFASYRNNLVDEKGQPLRSGQTLSINWPLWEAGGMMIDDATKRMLEEKTGMIPLSSEQGVAAFFNALATGESQVMVMPGNVAKITEKYLQPIGIAKTEVAASKFTNNQPVNSELSVDKLESALLEMSSALLKLDVSELDTVTALGDYGFDSITLTEFANRLSETYSIDVPPTIFFDYSTLGSLAEYLLQEYPAKFSSQSSQIDNSDTEISEPTVDIKDLLNNLKSTLLSVAAQLLKLDETELDTYTELGDYGFDSITLTELANTLSQKYDIDVPPTVFFDYPTIDGLSEYLLSEYKDNIAKQMEGVPQSNQNQLHQETLQTKASQTNDQAINEAHQVTTEVTELTPSFVEQPSIKHEENNSQSSVLKQYAGIAVVGMSGSFPQAHDLEAFWQNLEQGVNCISEVPKQRWDWQALYGDPLEGGHTSDVKWGGFMDNMDTFDPLFFGISPREAMFMDPQQRLLMTHCWAAIEDAGYAPSSLSGTNTGIFVGTAATGYDAVIAKAGHNIESNTATGTVPSVGPNRTSFFFNFYGPSEPIETACSSSLIAIHKAVLAIEAGDCEQALVGGINTIPNEHHHISFNKSGMLSKDGSCKTFSEDANGYVRGEGVGILFLKKLDAAKADGDHIYGVIRGSAQNHGGRANSLTSPNSLRQSEVLQKAYKKSGVEPSTVTYIEAHGTGTPLGDPIEINGIKSAFNQLAKESKSLPAQEHRCAIGSVKTNIGHLELAAGIAGVIKVLLQMKHQKIVKNLHFKQLNPYIALDKTPFYIAEKNHDWVSLKDEQGRNIPKRAGVSSFGFGGANAHVVLEEYIEEKNIGTAPSLRKNNHQQVVILLSAKTAKNLKQYAQKLLDFVRQNKNTISLPDLAYTLQVGRDAMDERLAFVVSETVELTEKLEMFINEKALPNNCYLGQVKNNKDFIESMNKDDGLVETMQNWLESAQYDQLLTMWSKGINFNWQQFYQSRPDWMVTLKRISAPTYPFNQQKIWPTNNKQNKPVKPENSVSQQPEKNRVLEILESLENGKFSLDEAINALPTETVE
ncbi:SDR family NAD(P)-dependent oxidoreductase [Aliikangiella sp. IMCC44359]|uniref:SDR family NAD(P)-dependent oxidoreductase n=1 Tax=Aliikangiella sp. IMCC44359 TaxID=3459125 RepID=UPI00403B347C